MHSILSDSYLHIPAGILMLLLFWGAAFILMLRIRTGGSKLRLLINILTLCGAYIIFQIILNLGKLYTAEEKSRLALWADSLPSWMILSVMLLLTAVFIWLAFDQYAYMKTHISSMSIRESFDVLDSGIAVYTEKGVPLVINPVMEEILKKAFEGAESNKRIQLYNKLVTYGADMIQTDVEHYYSFRKDTIDIEGRKCIEFICDDVSEEYMTNLRLMEKNERLKRLNAHMKELGSTIEKLTIENEILNAKVNVHDRLGQALLATGLFLNDKAADDLRCTELLDMWKESIGFLKSIPDDEKKDELGMLCIAADDVGVNILLNGSRLDAESFGNEITDLGEEKRHALITALHECMTNTLRHAGGDEMYIDLAYEGNAVNMKIRNNGRPPAGAIEEKGGLKSLRALVEKCGGIMRIEDEAAFCLSIEI